MLMNRLVIPPDQTPFPWNNLSHVEIDTPQFVSDWQVSLGGIMVGKNSDWCITTVDGVGLPKTNSTETNNPMLHGTATLGEAHDGRTIRMGLTGKFASPAEAWDKLRELAGAWQANVQDQPMRFRMTGDRTLVLFGHPRRLEEDTKAAYRGIMSVSVEFYADDPRFYSAIVKSYLIQLAAAGVGDVGFCFDEPLCMGVPFCVPHSNAGNALVVNEGNTRVAPVIIVVGNVTNVRAENTQTGEWWEWNGTTGSGELRFDHSARSVTLDGADVYGPLKPGSRFFYLDPGETQVNVRVTGGTGYASVLLRDGWF